MIQWKYVSIIQIIYPDFTSIGTVGFCDNEMIEIIKYDCVFYLSVLTTEKNHAI